MTPTWTQLSVQTRYSPFENEQLLTQVSDNSNTFPHRYPGER